jgi:CO/xanthine dehydrogenase Mo-binding subunit
MPPVPPALGNAVASLGYHPTTLPMTPERVLRSRRVPREAAG